MLAAIATYDLRIPGCSSLKEKRQRVKALTAGIRQKFNVSVAEVDHHELWQRTTLAVSAVGAEGFHLKKVMHEVERFVWRQPTVEIIGQRVTLHAQDD
jgi:hypothetical protein